MSLKKLIVGSWNLFNRFFEILKPFGDLLIRYYVFQAFFSSGLVKIASWSTTLMLFQFEYQVPFLPPEIAASLSVIMELGVSTLVLLGLGGRLSPLILFLFNLAAVLSYPFLWTQAGHVGLKDHICWGLLLMILVLHGPGKLSLDYLIGWIYKRRHAQ